MTFLIFLMILINSNAYVYTSENCKNQKMYNSEKNEEKNVSNDDSDVNKIDISYRFYMCFYEIPAALLTCSDATFNKYMNYTLTAEEEACFPDPASRDYLNFNEVLLEAQRIRAEKHLEAQRMKKEKHFSDEPAPINENR